MKKVISVMLALVLAVGVGCAFAESSALPAYVYAGEDPIWTAVVSYMQTTDFGFKAEEGGVLIPTPIILKTEPENVTEDTTEVTVYGNFWIFCYKQNGKILEETAGGECPGVMKLAKKDGKWSVVSLEAAEGGEDYAEQIRKLANGDEELVKLFGQTTGASEESMLPQYQRAAVLEYVAANGLEIEAYQETGWDPVSIID